MINYFSFFLCFWCNFLFFSDTVRSHSQSNIISQTLYEDNINPDHSSPVINQSHFIVGFWRGFHESEGFTVYYGYQFRSDGSFLARHRIYQDRQSIEDITWQGEWEFTDNILQIKGANLKNKTLLLNINLKLNEAFQLGYETGSLPESYQTMLLNKISN
jgi:hypothetical protein